MPTMLPIRYRDLWDVPRVFLVTLQGGLVLFDCPFDAAAEDYSDRYRLYMLPPLTEEPLVGSRADLPARASAYLGKSPLSMFASTRRGGKLLMPPSSPDGCRPRRPLEAKAGMATLVVTAASRSPGRSLPAEPGG